jgi:hypothetical protein
VQELEKKVIIIHVPPVTEGSTLYLGRIQLLSRHMSSSSCKGILSDRIGEESYNSLLHQMRFFAWHLLRRRMASFSFFLFKFMFWHPFPEQVGLASSIMFQLFSYFFTIDVTLGVISPSAHGLKMTSTGFDGI